MKKTGFNHELDLVQNECEAASPSPMKQIQTDNLESLKYLANGESFVLKLSARHRTLIEVSGLDTDQEGFLQARRTNENKETV